MEEVIRESLRLVRNNSITDNQVVEELLDLFNVIKQGCPKCGSHNITKIPIMYKCKKCGEIY